MRRDGRMRGSGGAERWPGGGVVVHPKPLVVHPKALGNGVFFSPACFGKTPSSLCHAEGWIQGPITHEARGF